MANETAGMAGRTGARNARSRRGVTLIEMLVVLVIIGLVATLSTLAVNHALGRSRQNAARAQMSMLSAGVMAFHLDQGRVPATLDGLETDSDGLRAPFPPGGYLQTEGVPLDPWGHAYAYVAGGKQGFTISTLGEDGAPGGDGFAADLCTDDRVDR